MNENNRQSNFYEINVIELGKALWSKAILILLCGALIAGLAGVYTKFLITPMYRSNTTMYVLAQQNSNYLTNSDLQASTYLTYDYAEIIKSRTVAQGVIDQLGLDLTADEMLNKISVSTTEETRVITISVSDPDPAAARTQADAVREQAAQQIMKVMNSEAVNVVDEADLPVSPYNVNLMKNLVLGAVIGCLLAVFIIALLWFLDDTIKSADDMEKYLGISVLGVIPKTSGRGKKSGRSSRSDADDTEEDDNG